MLAQNTSNTSILIWSLVLLAVVLAGFVVVSLVKKRYTKQDEGLTTGFTLSDLRQLHKQGKLSTEEFERAKAAITASTKAALDRKVPPPTDPGKAGGSFTNPDA